MHLAFNPDKLLQFFLIDHKLGEHEHSYYDT
jgi:hypothetical protein